jgi:hypothetical protein
MTRIKSMLVKFFSSPIFPAYSSLELTVVLFLRVLLFQNAERLDACVYITVILACSHVLYK